MDDLKILFYIAIGIGWLIVKNYNKVKSNRPVVVAKKNISSEPLNKQPEESKQPLPRTSFVSQKTTPANVKAREVKKSYKKMAAGSSSFTSGDSLKREKIVSGEKINVGNQDSNIFYDENDFLSKKFDIRTAIIYSEILKRPEF